MRVVAAGGKDGPFSGHRGGGHWAGRDNGASATGAATSAAATLPRCGDGAGDERVARETARHYREFDGAAACAPATAAAAKTKGTSQPVPYGRGSADGRKLGAGHPPHSPGEYHGCPPAQLGQEAVRLDLGCHGDGDDGETHAGAVRRGLQGGGNGEVAPVVFCTPPRQPAESDWAGLLNRSGSSVELLSYLAKTVLMQAETLQAVQLQGCRGGRGGLAPDGVCYCGA